MGAPTAAPDPGRTWSARFIVVSLMSAIVDWFRLFAPGYSCRFQLPLRASTFPNPKRAYRRSPKLSHGVERRCSRRSLNGANHRLPYPYHPTSTPSAATRMPCACSTRTGLPPQPCRIAYSRIEGSKAPMPSVRSGSVNAADPSDLIPPLTCSERL